MIQKIKVIQKIRGKDFPTKRTVLLEVGEKAIFVQRNLGCVCIHTIQNFIKLIERRWHRTFDERNFKEKQTFRMWLGYNGVAFIHI